MSSTLFLITKSFFGVNFKIVVSFGIVSVSVYSRNTTKPYVRLSWFFAWICLIPQPSEVCIRFFFNLYFNPLKNGVLTVSLSVSLAKTPYSLPYLHKHVVQRLLPQKKQSFYKCLRLNVAVNYLKSKGFNSMRLNVAANYYLNITS